MTQSSDFIRESALARLFEIDDHGTGVVLVDQGQQEAARAFLGEIFSADRRSAAFEVSGVDPRSLEGRERSRFEDGIFERSRRNDLPRLVYVSAGAGRLYIIPSVRKVAEIVDLRGLTFPTSAIANAAIEAAMTSSIGAERPRPSPTDTLWHQQDGAR